MNINIIQQSLSASIMLSAITCAFIQKTKGLFKTNKYLIIYALIINILLGIIFCYSFTNIKLPECLWIGLFSFIGADTIYKSLGNKLDSYDQIRNKRKNRNTQE